jgi:rhodanese-related sulfurtransferase
MYCGDLPPAEVFDRLKKNANAVLIDVRTQPEWTFVGLPQVDRLVKVAWQVYPMMDVNANFVDEVKARGLSPDTEIFLICRSGARSASAALSMVGNVPAFPGPRAEDDYDQENQDQEFPRLG